MTQTSDTSFDQLTVFGFLTEFRLAGGGCISVGIETNFAVCVLLTIRLASNVCFRRRIRSIALTIHATQTIAKRLRRWNPLTPFPR